MQNTIILSHYLSWAADSRSHLVPSLQPSVCRDIASSITRHNLLESMVILISANPYNRSPSPVVLP
jgi:hypothetical protein